MHKKYKIAIFVLLGLLAVLLAAVLLRDSNIAVLNPKGIVAEKQLDLIVIVTLLMLIVVVPVFILTFFIAWKYRESNTKSRYSPNWDHNRKLELVWWGVPSIIITVLGFFIWQSSHDLDPYKALNSNKTPVSIQVVALQWRWLFIYPEENIATVNYLKFPEDTPINFTITADSPMNSFWIPQLGGQIYAMPGMQTKLHLMANEPGVYAGSSANLSGEGFASMRFKATSLSQADYDKWVAETGSTSTRLDAAEYAKLVKPNTDTKPAAYATVERDLYDTIVMKYMTPDVTAEEKKKPQSTSDMEGMRH